MRKIVRPWELSLGGAMTRYTIGGETVAWHPNSDRTPCTDEDKAIMDAELIQQGFILISSQDELEKILLLC